MKKVKEACAAQAERLGSQIGGVSEVEQLRYIKMRNELLFQIICDQKILVAVLNQENPDDPRIEKFMEMNRPIFFPVANVAGQ